MIPYTPVQLLFFFYFYCFCGWIIECTYVSVRTKKVTNRGFMTGPFIPIYGFGAMALLIACTPVKKYPVAVFFVGMFAASVLEYFTGMLMEAIFKVRYWDYSSKKFNLNGHVCLLNSTYWGAISVILIYYFHKPIEALSEYMRYKELNLTVLCVSMYFLLDFSLSFKAAFDVRSIIIKLEKCKDEMRIMQKRLDVIMAYTSDSVSTQKDKIEERISDKLVDIAESLESRFANIKEKIDDKTFVPAENIRNEYLELREKFTNFKHNHFGLTALLGFHKRNLIKGNELYSSKYADSIETIKKFVNRKNK